MKQDGRLLRGGVFLLPKMVMQPLNSQHDSQDEQQHAQDGLRIGGPVGGSAGGDLAHLSADGLSQEVRVTISMKIMGM